MDSLTNNELAREWSDAKQRADIFLRRAMTCVRHESRQYNMDLHAAHARKAAQLLAELIRRTE
jgi:hypothetical protein